MEEYKIKEEMNLFLLRKQYEENPAPGLLEEIKRVNNDMEAEHDAAADELNGILGLTSGFHPPEGACHS